MFRRLAGSFVRITLMLLVGLALYFKIFENRFIFYPESELTASPHIPHEDVHFTAADGTRLNGWFVPFAGGNRVFIISHGNAGNIGDRVEMVEYVNAVFESSVFIYDYRGYGRSEGRPSESGLYSDLLGAIRYVRSRGYPSNAIYLLGQSLGTAVTVHVAVKEKVGGIILEAPFTSVRGMVRWYIHSLPFDYFLSARFDSLSKISKVRVPVAIVHAKGDSVVPFFLGQQLYDQATDPKKFFPIDAALHEGALMALGLARTRELRAFLWNANDESH